MTGWQIVTAFECLAIVVGGWKFHRIKEWVRGGDSRYATAESRARGRGRHHVAYQLDPVRAIDSVTILRPTPDHPHRWRLARTNGIAAVWSA